MNEVKTIQGKTCRSRNWLLASRYGLALLTVILLGSLSFKLAIDVTQNVTYFGTARAPHSDALGPWLHGALNYLFYGEPHNYLYRPTIGIFFGSIIAAFQRIDAIPIFFLTCFVLFLAFAIWRADARLKFTLVAWLAFITGTYATALQPLNLGNLMPDAPAFLFTLAGLYFVFLGIAGERLAAPSLWTGFLLLGIAATIRGPMMLAGPAIAVIVYLMSKDDHRFRLLTTAMIIFFCPIVLDLVSQKAYGVTNNGLVSLFCFYTDPTRSWSPECHAAYLTLKPAASEVLRHYLETLYSREGMAAFIGNLDVKLSHDGASLGQVYPAFGIVLLWSLLHTVGGIQKKLPLSVPIKIIRAALGADHFMILRLAAVGTALLLHAFFGSVASVLVVSLVIAVISIWLRLPRPLVALIVYWLGSVFLALLMQGQQDRLTLTFSFALYLAIFLAGCDRPQAPAITGVMPHTAGFLRNALLTIVVFLYLGVFLLPSEWRRLYFDQVAGKQAALEISRDRILDRCLYYTADRNLVYARCSGNTKQPVVYYSAIDGPQDMNASYEKPARFIK